MTYTEEKFYPFSTTDKYFIDPCKQYPVTICGQRVILTNGELYGRCRSTAWHHIHSAYKCYMKKFYMRNPKLVPYETIVRATSGEPEAVDEVLRQTNLGCFP